MPTFSVTTRKKEGKNKRRVDGRKTGRKQRNIQRKEKKGEEKKKIKFYINLFFRAHVCLFTFLSLFNIRIGIFTPINQF